MGMCCTSFGYVTFKGALKKVLEGDDAQGAGSGSGRQCCLDGDGSILLNYTRVSAARVLSDKDWSNSPKCQWIS